MPRLLSAIGLAVVAAVALAGCGGGGSDNGSGSAGRVMMPPPKTRFLGTQLTPPKRAPTFALHDANGHRYALTTRPGRYVLVTFIYTHCPDVCPLIAQNLNAALRQTSANAEVLAVSVDPKGDTPKSVRRFVRAKQLVPRFHFLLGTPRQLRTVWAKYGVAAVQRTPDLVDHVAYTALVDPQGRERVLYDSTVKARQVVHDLRVLSHGSGQS